jgi:hypothetical protein
MRVVTGRRIAKTIGFIPVSRKSIPSTKPLGRAAEAERGSLIAIELHLAGAARGTSVFRETLRGVSRHAVFTRKSLQRLELYPLRELL